MQKRRHQVLINIQHLEDKLLSQRKIAIYLQNLLASDILKYLQKRFGIEDIALVIFEYLNIEFCFDHFTHYPKIIKCMKCETVQRPTNDQVIYHFLKPIIIKKRRKREVTSYDRYSLQIDFHQDDYDFKRHLLQTISAYAHISYYHDNEYDDKVWWFIRIADGGLSTQYEIRNSLRHICDKQTYIDNRVSF